MNTQTTSRPWGHYTVLQQYGPEVKVKTLFVLPGASLSMQRHTNRREIWFVVEGQATVNGIDTTTEQPVEITKLSKFDMLQIDLQEWHQLINTGTETLHILEIQFGTDCTEDDIERKPNV